MVELAETQPPDPRIAVPATELSAHAFNKRAGTTSGVVPAVTSTFYLASTVRPGHSSVRNGVSGNPELLNMFSTGFSAHP